MKAMDDEQRQPTEINSNYVAGAADMSPSSLRPVEDMAQTLRRNDGDTSPTKIKTVQHILTTREVLATFAEAGLPRTPRSIERYCKQGDLDAYFDERRVYYVTPESVARLIGYIKEINQKYGRQNKNLLIDSPTEQPTPQRHDVHASPTIADTLPDTSPTGSDVSELRAKLTSLEIDKRVRDQIIAELRGQIKEDREHFTTQLVTHARRVGELETRLLQIEGPRREQQVIETVGTPTHAAEVISASGDELDEI